MKRMKALLALTLAIVMVLALGLPAMAVTDETITIRDAKPTVYNYAFYKIFDLDDSSDPFVYTLDATSSWASVLIDNANTDTLSAFNGLKFVPDAATPTEYTVVKLENYSAADFAAWLVEHRGTITADKSLPKDTASTATDVSVEVQEPGYWLVTYGTGDDFQGAEPYALTSVGTNKEAVIQNKYDMPFDKEVYDASGEAINEEGVKVGDILTYKITGAAPALGTDTDSYYYKVVDTLSKGLQYVGGLSVKIKTGADTWVDLITSTETGFPALAQETDLNRDIDTKHAYQLNMGSTGAAEDDPYTFVVNIDFKNITGTYETGRDTIEITYQAVVTDDAIVHVIDNQADLYYTRNGETEVRHAETRNYVVELVIDKFETGENSRKLEGATFVLYKDVPATPASGTPGDPGYVAAVDAHKEYYKYTAASGTPGTAGYTAPVISWVTDQTQATSITTDANGFANIVGLPDGTYQLLETAAPAGYVILDTPIEVVIDGSKALDQNLVVENDPDKTEDNQAIALTTFANVANTPGSVLPSTGGRGTTMLYMAGLGMMLAAGAFLIFRRRAEAGK